jgi:GntR family transcriptional regulator
MPNVLPIAVDKLSGIPVYIQLGERLRLLIREGVLRPGDMLPTVRELAVLLGVNANTVGRVYRELQVAGVLRLERGVGTYVAKLPAGLPAADEFRTLEQKALELIRLAKHAGMRCGELSQLIEARWQENKNERQS